jgi:hypothetical protein
MFGWLYEGTPIRGKEVLKLPPLFQILGKINRLGPFVIIFSLFSPLFTLSKQEAPCSSAPGFYYFYSIIKQNIFNILVSGL